MNISFFFAAFTSIFWLVFGFKYINLPTLSSAGGIETFYQSVIILVLPLIVIWGIFAVIKNYFTEKRTSHYIYKLMEQVQKNAETAAELSHALLGVEVEIKNGFILQEFNTLITDINESLSDIIRRSNSVSSAQIEHLWSRTAGGERWLIAKTFIEINNFQNGFLDHLLQKAHKDSLLKGSILEFFSRYRIIRELIENIDTQKVFYNMLESGAMGKVFNIITPIAQALERDEKNPLKATKKLQTLTQKEDFSLTEEPISIPSFLSNPENKTEKPQISAFAPSLPEKTSPVLKADRHETPISSNNVSEKADIPPAPVITEFSQTKSALRSIRRPSVQPAKKDTTAENKKTPFISLDELEKEINASPENNYDEYAYPFGAWLNDKNKK